MLGEQEKDNKLSNSIKLNLVQPTVPVTKLPDDPVLEAELERRPLNLRELLDRELAELSSQVGTHDSPVLEVDNGIAEDVEVWVNPQKMALAMRAVLANSVRQSDGSNTVKFVHRRTPTSDLIWVICDATTKPVHHVVLKMAKRLIESHGGKLEIMRDPVTSTVTRVQIPRPPHTRAS